MGQIFQLTTAVLGNDPSLSDYSPDYQPGAGHGLWAGKAGSLPHFPLQGEVLDEDTGSPTPHETLVLTHKTRPPEVCWPTSLLGCLGPLGHHTGVFTLGGLTVLVQGSVPDSRAGMNSVLKTKAPLPKAAIKSTIKITSYVSENIMGSHSPGQPQPFKTKDNFLLSNPSPKEENSS